MAGPRFSILNLGPGEGTISLNNQGMVLISPPIKEGKPQRLTLLWHNGNKSELPAGFNGLDLNDNGDIVGSALFGGVRHAALLSGGKVTDLTPNSKNATEAVAISNTRHIVLRQSGSEANSQGWLKKADQSTLIELNFVPVDVNDTGQVIGNWGGGVDAYFWENGAGRKIVLLPGQEYIAVSGLNDKGAAVGHSTSGGPGWVRAFLWHKGKFSELGTISHPEDRLFYGVVALHLNNVGDVVGYATQQGLPAAFLVSQGSAWESALAAPREHGGVPDDAAVLWKGTAAYNLNDQVPGMRRGKAGWHLSAACEINDRGQIVGEGVYQGKAHFFLLTPVTAKTGLSGR